MMKAGLRRITESGTFMWPWSATRGVAVISGAAGGGGGGGGAFCMQGLNLHGAAGGGGGGGGAATTLQFGQRLHVASGGNGGGGGSSGGITRDGKPLHGNNGRGCNFGRSDGGKGATLDETDDRVVANGGDGGRGCPGETVIVELSELSGGDIFEITVGQGGGGGGGGQGFESGGDGRRGIDGDVLFVPVYDEQDVAR